MRQPRRGCLIRYIVHIEHSQLTSKLWGVITQEWNTPRTLNNTPQSLCDSSPKTGEQFIDILAILVTLVILVILVILAVLNKPATEPHSLFLYIHFIDIRLFLLKATRTVQGIGCNARRARSQHQRTITQPTGIPNGILHHRTAKGVPPCCSIHHHILNPHLAAGRCQILTQRKHSDNLTINLSKEKMRCRTVNHSLQLPKRQASAR